MRYDTLQFWTLIATFVVPVLIGASCEAFMKAVGLTASAVFLGNLLYASLFEGWNGFGSLESRLLASVSSIPLAVLLGAAGFGLRRLWLYISCGPGLA
jgi:hypothetical protein